MIDEHKGTPAEVWLRHGQSTAAFTPSEGCWCTAFRVARNEEWFSVLAEPPSWEALRTRPTMYGNPLLFPYPYWVRDATFEYRGQVYHLPPGRELGRAIHGVVRDHAWTVERMWEDGDGAHLEATFRHEGELLAEYPFPFLMAATHTLTGSTLTDHWRVTNLGSGPMPIGLGIHPYFSLPLFAGGRVSDLRMQSDVGNLRPFDAARMQGARGEWPCGPAEGVLDMRPGQRVDEYLNAAAPAERSVLVLYSLHGAEAVAPGDGWRGACWRGACWRGACWRLAELAHGLEIAVETSGAFEYMANFSPPSRAVLSPVLSTCLPGALNLMGQGAHSGIIELAPGEVWEAQARITARWVG